MKIQMKWVDGLQFYSQAETGHGLPLASRLDSNEPLHGIRPVELILHALAGCSGMDIISILQKMKQPIVKYWIDVDADRADQHPKVFTKIRLVYHFTGKGIDPAAVEKAMHLSHTKYCSVSAMLSKACEIESSYQIHEE
ncbi:MAG: OsmC family protein [bacterium]|nr:OsmC family protein [bacterium]